MCGNRSEGTDLEETQHERFKEEVAKLRRVS
jgi:hypothetical protein